MMTEEPVIRLKIRIHSGDNVHQFPWHGTMQELVSCQEWIADIARQAGETPIDVARGMLRSLPETDWRKDESDQLVQKAAIVCWVMAVGCAGPEAELPELLERGADVEVDVYLPLGPATEPGEIKMKVRQMETHH
jgi:hypothetical protein